MSDNITGEPTTASLKQPFFVSSVNLPDYNWIIDESYAAAKAEANRVFTVKGIQTKIELLRPVHLAYATSGATFFTLPGSGIVTYTLKSNTGFFPWGVINNDPTWFVCKWYQGAGTNYIADWFVRPVYFFEEQQGAYGGLLEAYNFRGDQTFSFNNVSNTGSTVIQGWILAFVVMPTTLEETKITV
jgi:hypothetical protein